METLILGRDDLRECKQAIEARLSELEQPSPGCELPPTRHIDETARLRHLLREFTRALREVEALEAIGVEIRPF